MLADPRNLPHKARITIGGEWLDLYVTAITDPRGNYIGPMLTWSIVTDVVRIEEETARLMTMLDLMPINVMLADKDTFNITYVNKTSVTTLKQIEKYLPCKAAEVLGKSIDIFHKNPAHQRRLLGDYQRSLPHRAIINIGDEKLELNVSALNDSKGNYIGPMVTWSIVTESIALATQMQEVVTTVSSAATQMSASADTMAKTAEQSMERSTTVASASEELSASISEISRQISKTQQVTASALDETGRSMTMANRFQEAAGKIGDVVKLIKDIADQTNLLALNATIEAARAGESGKGFAVVAAEVKAFANQTAKATGDISTQISDIQSAATAMVETNQAINSTVTEINEIAASVGAAVEEQSAATQNVAENIGDVSRGASETGRIASDVNGAAGELAQRSDELRAQVELFLKRLGVAK